MEILALNRFNTGLGLRCDGLKTHKVLYPS